MNIAIIGGSGAKEVVKELGVEAREFFGGGARGIDYLWFDYKGNKVFFVLRHGKSHAKDPARLEPKYMAEKLEVLMEPEEERTLIIQTSASGSLDTSIKLVDEGGLVVCSDVMRGFGYKGSSRSIVEPEMVHAVIKGAYSERARKLALDAISKVEGATAYDGGIYINNQGNQFESPAEVAALYVWLDAPRFRKHFIQKMISELDGDSITGSTIRGELERQLGIYESLDKSLKVEKAQVSMNAARELEPLVESGFKDIVLLAFPVNYGVGLIPEEKVDHERTMKAISKGSKYIAGTLKNMIEMAGEYIT